MLKNAERLTEMAGREALIAARQMPLEAFQPLAETGMTSPDDALAGTGESGRLDETEAAGARICGSIRGVSFLVLRAT